MKSEGITYKELMEIENPTIGQLEYVIDETQNNEHLVYGYFDNGWACFHKVNYKKAWEELCTIKDEKIQNILKQLEIKYNECSW
jgi:hypothetical protein